MKLRQLHNKLRTKTFFLLKKCSRRNFIAHKYLINTSHEVLHVAITAMK